MLLHWAFGVAALVMAAMLMIPYLRANSLRQLNVIAVMFVCHMLQQMGTATLLMFDPHAVAAGTYFAASSLTAMLIPVGGLIGSAVVPATARDRVGFRRAPLSADPTARSATWWFFLFLFVACAVLLVIYTSRVGSTPLRELVLGSASAQALQIARREASPATLGPVFGMAQRFFMPALFLMAIMGLAYFRSHLMKPVCLAAMVIPLLYNAWASDKTPVVMLFVLALVVALLRKDETGPGHRWWPADRRTGRWSRKKRRRAYAAAAVCGFLAVGYAVFIFLFRPVAEHGLSYIIQHVFLRILFKPAMNSYYAIEAFTQGFDYTWFRDIRRLAMLLGWNYFDLSQEIAVYKGQTEFTNAPPTAIGNFYAQGGWPVLIAGVVTAAAVFKAVENAFYRARYKTSVHVALYSLLLYGAFRFSWANFHTILMTETILPLLLVLLTWSIMLRDSRTSRVWRHNESPAGAG